MVSIDASQAQVRVLHQEDKIVVPRQITFHCGTCICAIGLTNLGVCSTAFHENLIANVIIVYVLSMECLHHVAPNLWATNFILDININASLAPFSLNIYPG